MVLFYFPFLFSNVFSYNIYGSESKWSIANLKGFHWPKKERDKFTNQKNKCKVLNIQMC